jgi:cytochrome c-type biogenesis protein CcmE
MEGPASEHEVGGLLEHGTLERSYFEFHVRLSTFDENNRVVEQQGRKTHFAL